MSMPGADMRPDDGPWYACEECGCLMLAPVALCQDCAAEQDDEEAGE